MDFLQVALLTVAGLAAGSSQGWKAWLRRLEGWSPVAAGAADGLQLSKSQPERSKLPNSQISRSQPSVFMFSKSQLSILAWNSCCLQQCVTSFEIFYEQIYIFQGTGVCKIKACQPILCCKSLLTPAPPISMLTKLSKPRLYINRLFFRSTVALPEDHTCQHWNWGWGEVRGWHVWATGFFLQTPESDFFLWHDFKNFCLQLR